MEVKIVGFDDYTVDEFGTIRSYKYGKIRELKISKNTKGYAQVGLGLNGKTYPKRVHRLVAKAFIPNPLNLPQVNHIDGNKFNNSVTNLEWCSNSDNIKHSWEIGLREGVREVSRKSILKCHKLNCRPVEVVDLFTGRVIKMFKGCASASRELFPNMDDGIVRALIVSHNKGEHRGIKDLFNTKVFFRFGGDLQNVS